MAAALLAAVGVLRLASALPTRTTQKDFAHYYLTGHLLLEGRNPYGVPLEYSRFGFTVREEPVLSASHTPAFVRLFAPIAVLPREPAYWSWVGVKIVCLALILRFNRQLPDDRLTRRGFWFVGCGTLACAAVYWHFLLFASATAAGGALIAPRRQACLCLRSDDDCGSVRNFPVRDVDLACLARGRQRPRSRLGVDGV